MTTRILIPVIVLFAVAVPFLIGGETAKLPDIRAEAARMRREKQREEARERYEIELTKIDADFITELDGAVERATKAGELDRAVALRDAKDRIIADSNDPNDVNAKMMSGEWLRINHEHTIYRFRFDADGSIVPIGNDSKTNSWKIVAGRLFLNGTERWRRINLPAFTFKNGETVFILIPEPKRANAAADGLEK